VFVGRSREFTQLDGLLAEARRGQSGVLVLRGEPGIGKTKLLEAVTASAPEWRVLRTVGVESEAELAFAALHQLCRPSLDRLDQLPEPQRNALGAAFGLVAGTPPQSFLVGLATLSLLSATAGERPVLCVVDDAQWLDRESAQILAFVARRLVTDPIVMLFASRQETDELAGLPELILSGLAEEHAGVLLSSVLVGPLDPRIRSRIIDETRGNPLALLELPRGLTTEELVVGFGAPVDLPLPRRIEETFGRRIEQLPLDTRRLLLIAAADQLGHAAKVWRAAETLGIGAEAMQPAEVAALLTMDSEVRFRHPLVRSAAYRGASGRERQIVHRALADASDPVLEPDRRAWHLAAATDETDEAVANELERSAGRAHERGGLIAAAAFLERSAELTPDPALQARRRVLAAGSYLQAGTVDRAQELLGLTAGHLADPAARAQAMRLEGELLLHEGHSEETLSLLFGAAMALRELDPRLANETVMEALEAAMWAGHLTTETTVVDVAAALRSWFEREQETSTAVSLLRGFSDRLVGHYPTAVEWWRKAADVRATDVEGGTRLHLMGMMWTAMGDMLDFEGMLSIGRDRTRQAREQGALAQLPDALVCLAYPELLAGHIEAAEGFNAEAVEIGAATGLPQFTGAQAIVSLSILVWRGHGTEATALAQAIVSAGLAGRRGFVVRLVDYLLTTLELGHGRYEEARLHALKVFEDDPLCIGSIGLADLVEAAWRSNDAASAHEALGRLTERAEAGSTPWGLGLLARSRALMAAEDEAEPLYHQAFEHLDRAGVATDMARARLLYGEWLRRQRRRAEAREQLRAARDSLLAMGAGAFARRAEAELRATGEHSRARVDDTRNELTPQELQVAKLAAHGDSNSAIAAQLYISPHTVSYHLRRVYSKLDVKSRAQLVNVLARSRSG
jgi:DNA-binding CsgD family transcriptional regulator